MRIPKPSEDDKAVFRALVPDDPRVDVRPMFGNLGAFVDGKMFMGLFGSLIGLKLSPDDAADLRTVDGAGPFGPADRPMRDYVALPPAWRSGAEAEPWVARALARVAAMPPKRPPRR